jgi:hypothetical protein
MVCYTNMFREFLNKQNDLLQLMVNVAFCSKIFKSKQTNKKKKSKSNSYTQYQSLNFENQLLRIISNCHLLVNSMS